jgi:CBS domain-containing protein
MAAVGPLVSLAIGVLAWLLGSTLASAQLAGAEPDSPAAALLADVGPLATLLLWLGPVNVILGLFNLVPGFPLDGGRVLRAFLWWSTGDYGKASRWASRAGQVFAWSLIGFGAWSRLAGGLVQGLWFVLIGWFLNSAARSSYERVVVHEALEAVPVRDLMVTRLEHVPVDATAQELIDRYFMASDQRAFPVDAADGRFLGLVCFDDVRRLAQDRRENTRAGELMTDAARLATLPPDAEAERALEQMARRNVDQIPVLEDGRLLGLVRRRDIVKWLALRRPEHGGGQLAGT